MNTRSILKRSLLLGVLILFPLIATSCGGADPNVIIDDAVQEKRTGVLKSLGGMTVGDGTHILEMKDSTTLRLRSLNINLDQEKYLSKIIEIRGPITTAADGKDLMNVMSIDISEDEDSEEEISGSEKEYKNSDMGFKLIYIDSWDVELSEGTVTFMAPDSDEEDDENEGDMVVISKLVNPTKMSLEAFLQLPGDPNELVTLGYIKTKIGVDSLEGLKKESSDLQTIDLYLARNDAVYQLSFMGTDSPDIINNRNTFFSMTASFQFIGMTLDETDEDEEEDTEPDTANNLPDESEDTTEPEIDTPEMTEPEVTEETENNTEAYSSSSYGIVAQYIGSTIDSIAPEASESGSWSAYSFEFADPNYVYAEYTDGSETRLVLLTYEQSGAALETEVVGYFKPGDTTSWTRVSGENPVSDSEKTVISLGDSGAEEEAIVKQGYAYFESLPYHFQTQYPSNWYYSGSSGSEDVQHHYGFSNEPVEGGNELVSIDVISGSLPSGSSISVGTHSGVKVYDGDTVAIYIERDDGRLYKIHGDTGYEAYVIDIAASIKEN
jgi:hypothetical protein